MPCPGNTPAPSYLYWAQQALVCLSPWLLCAYWPGLLVHVHKELASGRRRAGIVLDIL